MDRCNIPEAHSKVIPNLAQIKYFLKCIFSRNPNLLLDQCKNSREFLRVLTLKKYDEIKKFMVSAYNTSLRVIKVFITK